MLINHFSTYFNDKISFVGTGITKHCQHVDSRANNLAHWLNSQIVLCISFAYRKRTKNKLNGEWMRWSQYSSSWFLRIVISNDIFPILTDSTLVLNFNHTTRIPLFHVHIYVDEALNVNSRKTYKDKIRLVWLRMSRERVWFPVLVCRRCFEWTPRTIERHTKMQHSSYVWLWMLRECAWFLHIYVTQKLRMNNLEWQRWTYAKIPWYVHLRTFLQTQINSFQTRSRMFVDKTLCISIARCLCSGVSPSRYFAY